MLVNVKVSQLCVDIFVSLYLNINKGNVSGKEIFEASENTTSI